MYIGFSDVKQTEIHTAEPQVPKLSAYEFEMAIEGLNRHKSPGIDQIPTEVITAGSRTIRSEIHKLISSIGNTEELREEWKELIISLIYNKGDETDYVIVAYHCVNYVQNFTQHPAAVTLYC